MLHSIELVWLRAVPGRLCDAQQHIAPEPLTSRPEQSLKNRSALHRFRRFDEALSSRLTIGLVSNP
jgi:hypothetical protein